MKDFKKELEDFEKHCLETNQLQVAELQHYAIKRIAEFERLAREVLATSTFSEDFQKILDRLEELLEQGE